MADSWYAFFTTSRLLYFLAGMVTSSLWHLWMENKRRDNHRAIIDWNPLFILAGIAVIVFIEVQQVSLADNVRKCQIELRQSYEETDELSLEQLEATSSWLKDFNNPPLHIANLLTNDLRYQQWAQGTVTRYEQDIEKVKNLRKKAKDERNKFSESLCGM